ncbi:hypothetical protein BJX63DRAFT_432747 [Aspergillus granulosus]|uniref:Uncharacterized protein n=1 Tax=Aspergillus granulosus TaxID=176169 RepID=A0ABR4HA05_9EURO
MSEPAPSEIPDTHWSNGDEQELPRTSERGDPSPSTFIIPPKEEDARDIGLFIGIGHDNGEYGRGWVLIFMYPDYTKCDYYQSIMTHEPPFDYNSEITDEYPYARLRLENMSADVGELLKDFQGWTPVGTIGEEHWEQFWAAWEATKPGPSQWFMGRFLDALATESLIERREADEIFACAVYSDYEITTWGGDGEYLADQEWVEELQHLEDERLVDELETVIEIDGRGAKGEQGDISMAEDGDAEDDY